MIKRFAVLSDVHGNLLALEAVMADFNARRVSAVLNLGDAASGPLWPRETAEVLMRQDWIQIGGNHERQLTRLDPREQGPSDRYAYEQLAPSQREWLGALPAVKREGSDLILCHGTPASDMTYLLETVEHEHTRPASPEEIRARLGTERAGLVLCGHSHTPRVVQLPEGGLLVNPGSVGLQAYEDDHGEAHVVEMGSPHARYAILEVRPNGWAVDLIAVPYDHRAAARRARENARPDWEMALLSGMMRKG